MFVPSLFFSVVCAGKGALPERRHREGSNGAQRRGAGNPSPGWERGRGEGPRLIIGTRRRRCGLLRQGQALIRRSAPPSPIREKGGSRFRRLSPSCSALCRASTSCSADDGLFAAGIAADRYRAKTWMVGTGPTMTEAALCQGGTCRVAFRDIATAALARLARNLAEFDTDIRHF